MPTLFLLSHDPGLLAHWQSIATGYAIRSGADWPQTPPDLVMADLDAPAVRGQDDAWWQARSGETLLIAATTCPGDEEGLRLLRCGVRGYCQAAGPAALLEQVLAVVAAGEIWAGRTLVQRLLQAVQAIQPPRPVDRGAILAPLSEREREVALLAARGAANKDIARQLAITERTVKAHLSAAFDKLAVADRVQLALKINGVLQ
ncbi:response regulator transcription factor [Chitinilyticum litopenaei]|uniref:response regulator transcription factor n=1 Tax=Chitinilyticum litopenaei TaxID=1121276 RepID=UPI0003F86B73|nr:response regulator transcription factor [Chitinilyticum litopenaei]